MNSNTQPAFVSPYAAPDEAPTSPVFAIPDFIDTPDVGAKVVSLFKQQATMPALTEDSYEYLLEGSGAQKLADSGVAPLVAAARGYSTITPEGAKDAATGLGLKLSDANGRQLKKAAETGDAMLMPWHNLAEVTEASNAGRAPESQTYQLRPSVPVKNAKGGTSKYLMPAGTGTILGLHPATPASWVSTAKRVLIAEGLLKADSAFSAHLAAHGVSESELLAVHGGNVPAARAALTEAMENVPEDERMLIISIASCTTWAGKTEWASFSPRGSEVWIAMDADVATNRAVWNQAQQLESFLKSKKAGSIGVVTLPPVNGDDKAGLDDFFAAGNSWAELEASVGELPAAPEIEIAQDFVATSLPKISLERGITYEVREVEKDGVPTIQANPTSEAAVVFNHVNTVCSPFPGMPTVQKVSGDVSWVVRQAGGSVVRRTSFEEAPMKLFIGNRATVAEAMAAITVAAGAGAVTRPGAGQLTLAAWSETMNRAQACQTIKTSGLWVKDGTLGFLTHEGHLTAQGLNPNLRGSLSERLPKIEIPFIDTTTEAAKVIEAWEEVHASSQIFHEAHTGLFDVQAGAAFIAAVGVQPKGIAALFMPPNSGKTSELKRSNGWYGPEWHTRPAFQLEASTAAVLETLNSYNNLVIGIDDARDKSGSKGEEVQLEAIEGLIRMGHDPYASPAKMKRDSHGEWVVPPTLEFPAKTSVLTGENLEQLGLKKSTSQRILSFQASENEPLFRKHGEIDPTVERLRESGAMSILMGAFIVASLRSVEHETNPRKALKDRYTALTTQEAENMAALPGGPVGRSSDLISPSMAGLTGLKEMVATAYEALGRHTEACELRATLETSRQGMVDAWKRHRAFYGNAADNTATPLIDQITDAIATGQARWDSKDGRDPYSNTPVIGRCDVSIDGKEDQIVLIPKMLVDLLRKTDPTLRAKNIKAAMLPLIKNARASVAMRTGSTYGWHISREAWDAVVASEPTVIEAESVTRAAAAMPKAAVAPAIRVAAPSGDFDF